jgi:hypothetical protein
MGLIHFHRRSPQLVGRVISLADSELIEIGPRIRLGPEPDHSRGRKHCVFRRQVLFAIDVTGDLGAEHRHSQRVPLLVTGDFLALEHRPLAVLDLIDAVVVFQWVVAGDVVVLRVLRPPEMAIFCLDTICLV